MNIQTIFIGIAVATFDWTTGSSRISNHLSSYERSSPIAAEPLTALAADDFDTHVQRLTLELADLWNATPAELPQLGAPVGWGTQWRIAREASRLLDDIGDELARSLRSRVDRTQEREALRLRIGRFGTDRLGWPADGGGDLASEDFYSATVAFLREAHAFDPRLPVEQLCQALRNVWVGNSLQKLLDRPPTLCPALFAYSMLYPVTDNWLDDPSVPRARKYRFNERLAARLRGAPVQADDGVEVRAYRLIERIEADLPRVRFPHAYASLLAIHASQSRSLEQHGGSRLDDRELLAVSIAKGGTSVLANHFLIGATAEPRTVRFAFEYGVVLQLLDDLQDLETDCDAGHETLFTRAARSRRVDETTARLGRFIDVLLPGSGSDTEPGVSTLRRHCIALLVDSVAANPKAFSRAFRRRIGRRWPVSLHAQRKLTRRAIEVTHTAAAALIGGTRGARAERVDRSAAGVAQRSAGSTPPAISAMMLRQKHSSCLNELRSISPAERGPQRRSAQRNRAPLSVSSRADEGAAR